MVMLGQCWWVGQQLELHQVAGEDQNSGQTAAAAGCEIKQSRTGQQLQLFWVFELLSRLVRQMTPTVTEKVGGSGGGAVRGAD